MTQKSSFFNSVSGDRKYNAADIAAFFGSFIGNGIYPNPSTNLAVTAAAGMNISVAAGKGWINGYYYENTDALNMTIDVADGVLKRIDRVVLRLDQVNRQIILAVLKGTPASSPVALALTKTTDIYELALSDVLINNGDTSVIQANITDQRLNTLLCGIVHGTVDQVDTATIFNQYQAALNSFETTQQADFEAWVASLQDILDADTAGNLLNLINGLAGTGRTTETVKGVSDALNTHKADYTLQVPFGGTTTGSANTYAIATPAITALTIGMAISVKFNVDSTGASTLNWNGKGAKGIKKSNGSDVTNLKSTGIYTLRYDGTNFILQGEGASGNALASDLLSGKTASTDAGDITGTLNLYTASSDIAVYSDTNQYTRDSPSPTVATAYKNFRVNFQGSFRLSVDVESLSISTCLGLQIYINDTAVGTQHYAKSSAFVTYTEDFTVNVGDKVSIYMWSSDSAKGWWLNNIYFRVAMFSSYPTSIVAL